MLRPVFCTALLVFALLLVLTGCLTTAKNTRTAASFSTADLDSVAVVFSEGGIARKNFWAVTPDTAATTTANRIVPRLLSEFAPHFGVTLVDARTALAEGSAFHANALASLDEAVEAIRAENHEVARTPFAAGFAARNAPLDYGVAEELIAVGEQLGTRYLLSISVVGWDATAGEKILDGLARFGAAAGGIFIYGGEPNRFAMIESTLIDTERGEVVWYSTRGADVDPQDPDHVAALTRTVAFELFDGRLIPPQSFLTSIDQDAVVYRFDGPRVTGRVTGFDGLDVVVETRDGEERVPLREVKSIRGFGGTGKLFPLALPMAE